jgi:hypothetical protein
MPVLEIEVVKDAIFIAGKQLRKVSEIEGGHVHYLSKGTKPKHPFEQWGGGHPASSPPKLDTFIGAVDHLLTAAEIDEFITEGVLIPADRRGR